MRKYGILLLTLALRSQLDATSCSYPPPCDLLRANSVLFVGTVIDPGTASSADALREVRFAVDENFAGLAPETKDVVVEVAGSWLKKGYDYLIDARRGSEGLSLGICGASGEVTSSFVKEDLNYLRERAKGKAGTSIRIWVSASGSPLADAEVTAFNGKETRSGITKKDGSVVFADVAPGHYRIASTSRHYTYDPERSSDKDVEVLSGTCPGAHIAMVGDGGLKGRVQDANGLPVPSLALQIFQIPDDPSKSLSMNKPWYQAETDGHGHFEVRAISPGRYYLGTNLEKFFRTSTVPRTYYPGRTDPSGAVPIEIHLGELTDNVVLTLPDFGPRRKIRICVVDQDGHPTPAAFIHDSFTVYGAEYAAITRQSEEAKDRLSSQLQTGPDGCSEISGLAKAAYAVSASTPGPNPGLLGTRRSETVVVPFGKTAFEAVLKLGPPFVYPKMRQ